MYKAIYYIVLILLVSCTSESRDILDSFENQGCGIPVQFTYSIDDLEDLTTRSIITSPHLPNDSRIGVFALREQFNKTSDSYQLLGNQTQEWNISNVQDYFNNAQYKSVESSNVFGVAGETNRGVYPDNVENPALRIYAYYPYTKSLTYVDGQAPYLTIQRSDSFNEGEQVDYLYSGCIHSLAEDEYADISFHHAQARISISFHNSKDVEVQVNSISIVTTQNQSGTLYIATGDFVPNEGSSVIEKELPSDSNAVEKLDSKTIGDFLLFPNGTETIETIAITIDGVKKIVYSRDSAENLINMTRGKVVFVEFKY